MTVKPEKMRGAEAAILTVRGMKVILDAELARLYGVPTKRLNEQVRRNTEKFPPDFMFQLSAEELKAIRSKNATSSLYPADNRKDVSNWSQIATGSSQHTDNQADGSAGPQTDSKSQKHRGQTYRSYAFTEHGAIMAATVLNSPQAVQMTVFVVRAFVRMREQLLGQAEMEARLAEIERTLLSHDAALRTLYQKIRPLLLPPPEPPRKQIGFQVKEPRIRYSAKKGRPR